MPEYYTQDFNDLRLPGMPDPVEVDRCIPRFHTQERLVDDQIVLVEWVEIITPGDRLSRPVQKVTDAHRKRWPRQYAAFKAGVEPSDGGHGIGSWSEMGWQLQIDMRAMGFNTIEQLANAHDGQLAGVPNGSLWRKKAKDWLAKNVTVQQVQTKDSQIEALQKQVEQLMAMVKENARVLSKSEARDDRGGAEKGSGEHPPRRGPGRPRKAQGVGSVQPGATPDVAAE